MLQCSVLFCLVLYCSVLYCLAAYAASQTKTSSVLVTLADNMKCDVVCCGVLFCSVLFCARQLMLPANATSLFCRYPLGTWHKPCCSYVYCPNLFYDMLNYLVLCVVASCLCHIQNGYLLLFCVMYCSVLCCSVLYCLVLFCLDLWASIKQQIICFVVLCIVMFCPALSLFAI